MENEFQPGNPPPPSNAPTPPPLPPPPASVPVVAPKRSRRGWIIGIIVGVLLLGALAVIQFLGSIAEAISSIDGGRHASHSHLTEVVIEAGESSDKIAVIPIEGIITSSSFDGSSYNMVKLVEDQLELAAKDHRVKAVLLKVNSPGGEVLASDDIYEAIKKFQNEHNKPVVASMGNLAASGGYYVSAPCRWIIANELTITGSIGVIMHAYNYRGLMNKVGMRPMVYKSGKFKDMLSGEKDLENPSPALLAELQEEEAMLNTMIGETFGRFKKVIEEGRRFSNNRNQLNKDGETGRELKSDWTKLADGRILSGKEAFANGFVDETGNWRDAIRRTEKLAGIQDADLITYQMPFSLGNLFNLFGKSSAKSIKLDIGIDMPKLRSGLYYLAPSFAH